MKRGLELFTIALALAGGAAAKAAVEERGHEQAHVHAHGSAGPHGGQLLELGAEEYHAELVLDHARNRVTVYLLDGAARADAPIEAEYLNVNLKSGGRAKQYRLPAERDGGAEAGPASCFALESAALMKALHDPGANPRLSVRIGAKGYVARIAHHHEQHEHAPVRR